MPIHNNLPAVTKCCGCVTDLKTASAIIAVLGIVTSPALSWAVVRHAYVIRVSCVVTTSAAYPDVVDINLNNILSFGFGANAGLGYSCLFKNTTQLDLRESSSEIRTEQSEDLALVKFVRYIGWVVLMIDVVFLIFSVYFLIKLFKGDDRSAKSAANSFMIAAFISVFMSFVYGMIYVIICAYTGGSFPIFEFFFSIFDLVIWVTWIHFLWVIYSYAYGRPKARSYFDRNCSFIKGLIPSIIIRLYRRTEESA